MVEVFKTSVKDIWHANLLLSKIHNTFAEYTANFDLEDCDNILRVQCPTGNVHASLLIDLLKDYGFHAEILPDNLPAVDVEVGNEILYSQFE